jgi:hypothetical protein
VKLYIPMLARIDTIEGEIASSAKSIIHRFNRDISLRVFN